MVTALFSRIAQLSFRTKLFVGVFLVFLALVLGHIHGSSIALSSKFWAPTDSHFIAKGWVAELEKTVPPERMKKIRPILQADPKFTRSDEWSVSTMWTLAQFNHDPRFPVINRNLGKGQNMLIVPWVPVLHLSAIARPVTWGYMLLGQQAGLAWYWWFSPFFCFVTLYLVIEVLLPRDRFLALLGAFWFCASAYVVSWSHYPAYLIGFANLTLLGAYAMLKATHIRNAIAGGAVLGYGAAGVVMYLYIPWIVPLAYTFAAILLGLIVRDRLLQAVDRRLLLFGLAAAAIVGGLLVGSFLVSSLPQLSALANSAYPGVRRLSGGDCSLARLFGGFYNFLTLRKPFLRFPSSEWAGFFLFLPTIVLAAVFTRRVRQRFDAVAWALTVVGIALALYGEVKFPQWLANATLFSRFQGYRAQVATGLVSILLSLYLLRRQKDVDHVYAGGDRGAEDSSGARVEGPGDQNGAGVEDDARRSRHVARLRTAVARSSTWVRVRWRAFARRVSPVTDVVRGLGRYQWLMIAVAVLGGFAFYLTTGASLHAIARLYRTRSMIPWQIWVVSGGATAASVLLVLGCRRLFAVALVPALILTAADFNPLSRGFAPLEKSEMWQAIRSVRALDKAAGRESMWAVSGGPHAPIIGTTASAMGAKSMTGVFYHPQLDLWHTLDPEAVQEKIYNRYSETHYFPLIPGDPTVRFTLPGPANFNVRVAPDNPRMRELGVRYALTYDRHTPYEAAEFPRIYMSADRRLRIYQIPE